MAKITINGQEFEVPAGQNLVDAAEENGIDIPHYCYHPGLAIAGQCRMCLVEQEGNPKLQIACNMKCSDGLKVNTNSERVTSAVQSSLEMHLINHPIDCPICDQAGECGLQDYYMKHGKYASEMAEEKVHKEKVVDLGDHVVLDKERCILCSRCVRFTADVSKTNDFGIFQRGDRSMIGTYNDAPLKGNYQLNTVDICPVGALTSKDFRFEQRVWFLDSTETICGGCSKGCNVFVHHKKGKHIYRLKPRYNEQVNSYWMCDQGRYTYKAANYDKRLTQALLGGVELSTDEAIQSWATSLKVLSAMERMDEVGVFLTPHLTNEEVSTILSILHKDLGVTRFYAEEVEKFVKEDHAVDGLLLQSDPYPNSRGFLKAFDQMKLKTAKVDDLVQAIRNQAVTHVIVIGSEDERCLAPIGKISRALAPDAAVTALTPQKAVADLFSYGINLPTLSHYEKVGTMTNSQGMTQQLQSPLKMFKEARSIQEILQGLQGRLSETRELRERAAQ
jgi:NADH-quinone oxidoreductase subunit G